MPESTERIPRPATRPSWSRSCSRSRSRSRSPLTLSLSLSMMSFICSAVWRPFLLHCACAHKSLSLSLCACVCVAMGALELLSRCCCWHNHCQQRQHWQHWQRAAIVCTQHAPHKGGGNPSGNWATRNRYFWHREYTDLTIF